MYCQTIKQFTEVSPAAVSHYIKRAEQVLSATETQSYKQQHSVLGSG